MCSCVLGVLGGGAATEKRRLRARDWGTSYCMGRLVAKGKLVLPGGRGKWTGWDLAWDFRTDGCLDGEGMERLLEQKACLVGNEWLC